MRYLTTDLDIEVEVGGELKEFSIEFTAPWDNDSIGSYEFQGHKGFDKREDFLGDIQSWKVNDEVTPEEKGAIDLYIDNNSEELRERMVMSTW